MSNSTTINRAYLMNRILNFRRLSSRLEVAYALEQIVTKLLENIVLHGKVEFHVINTLSWRNCTVNDHEMLGVRPDIEQLSMRSISYNQKRSRHRFSLILYVLAEVHQLLLNGGNCTYRELYYKNVELAIHQSRIYNAVRDVCNMLQQIPLKLGVLASGKGLIAGALCITMANGDVIDCQSFRGATLIPYDFTTVARLDTNASYVLVVEKDTIFEKLIAHDIFDSLSSDIILITGKGVPDLGTRLFVHRLSTECSLPIYILVDADPFGLEIMLVYRHGSRAMANFVDQLAAPKIRWIGIHPSEIVTMGIPTTSFTRADHAKLKQLLRREYLVEGVRHELRILKYIARKCKIEDVSWFSLRFLVKDYIPNKVKRNLFI